MSKLSPEFDDDKSCIYFNPVGHFVSACTQLNPLKKVDDEPWEKRFMCTDVMDGWEVSGYPDLEDSFDYYGFPYRGPQQCAEELFALACSQSAVMTLDADGLASNIEKACRLICTDKTFAAMGSSQERFSFVQGLMEQQHFKERTVPEEEVSGVPFADFWNDPNRPLKWVKAFVNDNGNGEAVLTVSPQELLDRVHKDLPQREAEPLQAQAVVLNLDSQTIYAATDRDINALGREYLTQQALDTVSGSLQSAASEREQKAAQVIGNLLDVQLGDDSYRNQRPNPGRPIVYQKGIVVAWPQKEGIKAVQRLMTLAAASEPALTKKAMSFIASERLFSFLGSKEKRLETLRTLAQSPAWLQEVKRVRNDVVTRREAPSSKYWVQGLSLVRKSVVQNERSR